MANIIILPLLILVSDVSAHTDLRRAGALEVFKCDFEGDFDVNFDLWPDGWKRARGGEYPHYVKVGIAMDDQPRSTGDRCLKIELDGGAALIRSPMIEVSSHYSYELEACVKTADLIHDVAYLTVTFYDDAGRVIESHDSRQIRHAPEWTLVKVGPLTPPTNDVSGAAITFHLRPTTKPDLRGTVMFDDVWLGRLPRMSLETQAANNLFTDKNDVEVGCRVSGLFESRPRLRFELLDVDGKVLSESTMKLVEDVATDPIDRHAGSRGINTDDGVQGGVVGQATWKPDVPRNGFYQVRVSVPGRGGSSISRLITLAVIAPSTTTKHGRFGWSLPGADRQVSLKSLFSLLKQAGIHWVKFPVWYRENARADQLAWFAERLSGEKIQLVGVLDQPPAGLRELFGEGGELPVASVFAEPDLWHPVIDPVMTRLSLKVRWWQLGADDDTSFVNYPDLVEKLAEIRKGFSRFGQKISLGISWRWIDEAMFFEDSSVAFLSYVAEPPLTDSELGEYLSSDGDPPVNRWVILRPLDSAHYDLESRARDLVLRMLAAAKGDADGIFIPDPFDARHGLLNQNGSPKELFLPWRTTALLLSDASYVGSIELPHGSKNVVFEREGQAIMIAWNDSDVTETVYVGDDIELIDIWGNRSTPDTERDENGVLRQRIDVGRLPRFITGVNPMITRWRLATQFETRELASIFGRQQRAVYRFENVFQEGVGGNVTLHAPDDWVVDPASGQFKLSAGEKQTQRVFILLGTNAGSGQQPVKLDFNVSADRSYKFTVYRSVRVGLGDIEVELASHLDEDGNLVVEQHLTNTSESFVNFNCFLFVPGRRKERRQVFNLGRGRTTNRFVLPDGESLLGKTLWLRAEEFGGARVLNEQIVAEE